MLTQSSCKNLGGMAHLFPALQHTGYKIFETMRAGWEELSLSYAVWSYARPPPTYMHPTASTFCLMTAKTNNATKINFSGRWDCPGNSWSLLRAVIFWWRIWLQEALLLLPLLNDASKRFSLTKLPFWLKYLSWDYPCLMLYVQSASQMNSLG